MINKNIENHDDTEEFSNIPKCYASVQLLKWNTKNIFWKRLQLRYQRTVF